MIIPKKSGTRRQSTAKQKIVAPASAESLRYWEGVGRRKTAVARVRLFSQSSKDLSGDRQGMVVNERDPKNYFPNSELFETIRAPFGVLDLDLGKFFVSVRVRGGGVKAQAEAVRHGLARALVKFNPEFRGLLKPAGFLRRDPRMVERKKYGLKKARRAPQWAKR